MTLTVHRWACIGYTGERLTPRPGPGSAVFQVTVLDLHPSPRGCRTGSNKHLEISPLRNLSELATCWQTMTQSLSLIVLHLWACAERLATCYVSSGKTTPLSTSLPTCVNVLNGYLSKGKDKLKFGHSFQDFRSPEAVQ